MSENLKKLYENEHLDLIDMKEDFDIEKIDDINEDELMNLGKFVCSFMKNAPKLTKEENTKYAIGAQEGDKDAELVLLRANGKLVIYFVKRYMFSGIPFEDLFQEGLCGLMVGIHKYDATKECAFSTYVSYWIKCKIRRYVTMNSSNVRIPAHMYEKIVKYRNMESDIENGKLPEMSDGEKANYLKLSLDKYYQVNVLSKSEVSLDKEITSVDGEVTLMDSLEAPEDIIPENVALENDKKEFCREMLQILDEKEKYVVMSHLGFNGERKSLEELGKEYEVSRERIRQIELRAFKKLRRRYGSRVEKYLQYA